MAVSILHRITGAGLTIVGLAVLTWWLVASSGGAEAYATFTKHVSAWYGTIVLIGLTWAYFQHLFSGIRHLVMDTGMGFELRGNKAGAVATIIASIAATALLWAYYLGAFK